MHLFQWIILFFIYAFISVAIATALDVDPTYVFFGIPIVFIVCTGVLTLFVMLSSSHKKTDPTKKDLQNGW